jgi:hypothetical protein
VRISKDGSSTVQLRVHRIGRTHFRPSAAPSACRDSATSLDVRETAMRPHCALTFPRRRCPTVKCRRKNVISNAYRDPAQSKEAYVSTDPRRLTRRPAHHRQGNNGDITTRSRHSPSSPAPLITFSPALRSPSMSHIPAPRNARPLSPPSPPMSCLECAPPRMRSVRPRNASDALRRRARLHEIPASAAGPRQNSSTTTCTKRFQEAPPLPPCACPSTNPSHQTPSPAPPPGSETSRPPPPNHNHAPYPRTPPLAATIHHSTPSAIPRPATSETNATPSASGGGRKGNPTLTDAQGHATTCTPEAH